MRLAPLLALSLILGCVAAPRAATPSAQEARKTLLSTTLVQHAPIDEMSGIVKSRRYENLYWVHNDSGDSARLFAIRENGTTWMPAWLSGEFTLGPAREGAAKPPWPGIAVDGAAHFDWEDIALDGETLYIADVGNNGNARRDLAVYAVPEPNPEAVERTHILKRLPVVYPDQGAFPDPVRWHFDCEAVFVYKGKLHFLTKHRIAGQINLPETGANLYRLDTQHTDRPNRLKKLDGLPDLGGWVTGADVSPDGKTLAVLCHAPIASVWLFELGKTGDRLLHGAARRLVLEGAKQCEAVCFADNDTLLVTNEQRDIFRLRTEEFAPTGTPGAGRR